MAEQLEGSQNQSWTRGVARLVVEGAARAAREPQLVLEEPRMQALAARSPARWHAKSEHFESEDVARDS